MRSMVFAIALVGAPMGAHAHELVTAPRAILCLNASSVEQANVPDRSQQSLRRLRCLRTEAGIPSTLVSGSSQSQVWEVLFRPAGMSGGVRLWARPTAFTEPDGAPALMQRASR